MGNFLGRKIEYIILANFLEKIWLHQKITHVLKYAKFYKKIMHIHNFMEKLKIIILSSLWNKLSVIAQQYWNFILIVLYLACVVISSEQLRKIITNFIIT